MFWNLQPIFLGHKIGDFTQTKEKESTREFYSCKVCCESMSSFFSVQTFGYAESETRSSR